MADLAQLVRASDCGPEGHGFESHSPPHFFILMKAMKLCFAPMDGITTCATRFLTQKVFETFGEKSDTLFLWTEFMNIDGFLINPRKVCKHLLTTEHQKPILQIYGGNKETLIKGIREIDQHFYPFFRGIELNTWCPSNSVMKVGGGSELMKDKQKTLEIIKALSENLKNLPFSIKTRAWLNEGDKEQQRIFIQEASRYCKMISIHGRTLKQGYTGDADWEFIQQTKEHLANSECLLFGNGGITSYQEAQQKKEQYGLDGIMIGQGAIGNPWIFCKYNPTYEEKMQTILDHLDVSIACEEYFQEVIEGGDENYLNRIVIPEDWITERIQKNRKKSDFSSHAIIEFRKFLFQYVKGIPWSKEWKVSILAVDKYQELRDSIQSFFLNKKDLDF